MRRNMEAFMMAFDSNLAPIVGQQITRTSDQRRAVDPRIDAPEARADAGECDVVAKGVFGGEMRGSLYIGGGLFLTDRGAEAPDQRRARCGRAPQRPAKR